MSDLHESWDETPKASDLTLKELTTKCQEYADLREKKKELEERVSEVEKQLTGLEGKILEYLKEYGLPNFKGAFGTISIRNTKTVVQPATAEDKRAFFDYLREQGIFEDMVAVNSRTLSSWANKEIEAKEKEGVYNWTPPGLKPAVEFQKITLTKAK